MTSFRDDPYWQAYWENKHRDEKVSMYSFAPFFELAGILLRASAQLLPQYRRRRAKELIGLAQGFENHVRHLRGNGIGWMVNAFPGISPFMEAKHHRSHHVGEPKLRSPGAADRVLSIVIEFLFLFEETFIAIEKDLYSEASTAVWFFNQLETLTDQHRPQGQENISDKALRMLGRHAVLLECEGLAYAQAMIESGFLKKMGKKRNCTFSEAEISKLAHELDIHPDVLREASEAEHSSWWDVSKEYRDKGIVLRDEFIDTLALPSAVSEAIRDAWDIGSTHLNVDGFPYCRGEDSYEISEKTTKLLITMFLTFPGFADPGDGLRKIGKMQTQLR